jgi:hypothetical protein
MGQFVAAGWFLGLLAIIASGLPDAQLLATVALLLPLAYVWGRHSAS